MGAPPLLHDLIFGESALNDALSIVLFNIFRRRCSADWQAKQQAPPAVVLRATSHHSPPSPPPWYSPVAPSMEKMAEDLLIILPLSLAIGVAAGLYTALATKGMQLQNRAYAELSLLLVAAMLTYTITDQAELSGILSLFFAGITMRHYTYYNLSPAAQATARTLFATVSSLCDIALSLILGIAVVDYSVASADDERAVGGHGRQVWDFPLICYSPLVLLAARALNIFPLTEFANFVRAPSARISCRMQLVMWWSGLRGAVSFALAATLDDSRPEMQVMPPAHAKAIATTTLAIVIGTNLLLAPLTAPLIRALKLQDDQQPTGIGTLARSLLPLRTGQSGEGARAESSDPFPAPLAGDHEGAYSPIVRPPGNPVHRAWRLVDQLYLKPLFGGRLNRGLEQATEEALGE